MKTAYEIALDEFRDAGADVRLAFGAVADTREKQILANRAHSSASDWHNRAVARLDAADKALREVEVSAPTPADIDAAKGLGVVGALTNGAAGTTHVADPAEQGIG